MRQIGPLQNSRKGVGALSLSEGRVSKGGMEHAGKYS